MTTELQELLIDHMDSAEPTIQGSFCSLLNWCEKTMQRLGVNSRGRVARTAEQWWQATKVRDGVTADVRDMLGLTIDTFCRSVAAGIEIQNGGEN